MSEQLRQQISERLQGMADAEGIVERKSERRNIVDVDRDWGRIEPRRPIAKAAADLMVRPAKSAVLRPKASDRPVPKEARDLEGMYCDAPDAFAKRTGVGPAVVRMFVIAVEWDKVMGSQDYILRVTGRDCRTKNVISAKLADLSNFSEEA